MLTPKWTFLPIKIILPVTAGPQVFLVSTKNCSSVGSLEQDGSARTMALKAANSAVDIARHSSTVTTLAVRPRTVVASENSSNSKVLTKRTSSAMAVAARPANRLIGENFIVNYYARSWSGEKTVCKTNECWFKE